MEQRELQSLSDQRQIIHDLIALMHKSGLSPPEEELLLAMEAEEFSKDFFIP